MVSTYIRYLLYVSMCPFCVEAPILCQHAHYDTNEYVAWCILVQYTICYIGRGECFIAGVYLNSSLMLSTNEDVDTEMGTPLSCLSSDTYIYSACKETKGG